MDNENNDSKREGGFKPPKLPYAWLATTFIAPTLVVAVPQLFNKATSLTTLIIMALALLSVLLFVLWLVTFVKLYNEAYSRQAGMFYVEISKRESKNVIELVKKAREAWEGAPPEQPLESRTPPQEHKGEP